MKNHIHYRNFAMTLASWLAIAIAVAANVQEFVEAGQEHPSTTIGSNSVITYPYSKTYVPFESFGDGQPTTNAEWNNLTIYQDHIDFESVVPADTDWFGFHFVRFDLTEINPDWAVAYHFQFDHHGNNNNGTTASGTTTPSVTVYTMYLKYMGDVPDGLHDVMVGTSSGCTAELAELDGLDDNDYDDQQLCIVGMDFLINPIPNLLIIARTQPVQDVNITDVEEKDGSFHVHWTRSRLPPFDDIGKTILFRYASAPLTLDDPSLAYYSSPPFMGRYKYHGPGNRVSGAFDLLPPTEYNLDNNSASSSSLQAELDDEDLAGVQVQLDEKGLQMHSNYTDDGTLIVLVGGDVSGWRVLPTWVQGYQNITARVGTVLRFVYSAGMGVALLPTAQAWNDCDMNMAVVLARGIDSPFDLTLLRVNDDEAILYITTPVYGACQGGMKFVVTVVEEADHPNGDEMGPAENENGSDNTIAQVTITDIVPSSSSRMMMARSLYYLAAVLILADLCMCVLTFYIYTHKRNSILWTKVFSSEYKRGDEIVSYASWAHRLAILYDNGSKRQCLSLAM